MHALEIGSAGQVAFATRAVPAWHMLGTVFAADEHVTTAQMLEKASLNGWNVRLVDADEVYEDARFTRDCFFVVRDNPFDGDLDVLATVGGKYKVVQNEDLFAFGDNLLDGGGQWETAGSIHDGRQVFGSLAIDREVIIDPTGAADKVLPYLLVNTSHDGTVGIQASTTAVRVVCQNTLNVALKGAKQTFKMRHTSTIDGRIAEAKTALALSHKYLDAFELKAQAFYETALTDKMFADLIATVHVKPENESKAALTRWDNKMTLVSDLYYGREAVDGAPITGANITGTAWGAFNALTERLDWYRTAREGDATSVAEAASGFNHVQNVEKNRILSVVSQFVGV